MELVIILSYLDGFGVYVYYLHCVAPHDSHYYSIWFIIGSLLTAL